jgi:endonuclease/exonuclease/phosphatase family metal-dependent hydrolase
MGPQPAAQARELVVATWNLGWHLSTAEARAWIAKCNRTYARDEASGLWRPDPQGTRTGWQLRWGRDAPIAPDPELLPPCDVYQASRRNVAVTAASYERRGRQIAQVVGRLGADVIAFQEVSGERSVREILPDGGRDFHVCSHRGPAVQRLAFAWRRTLGEALEPCETEAAIGLPERGHAPRVRPGLSMALRVEGKRVRFLNVHLKSGCVSPLEGDDAGRGQLAGDDPACQVLQRQLAPLEQWLTAKAAGADHLVLLGDLNRDLWHEARAPAQSAVRVPEGDPRGPPVDGTRSTSLLREVNDGEPPETELVLLAQACPSSWRVERLCSEAGERRLAAAELRTLSAPDGLGCRNPVGLDHILVDRRIGVHGPAVKVELGLLGRTLPPSSKRPEPLLGVSDHCPLVARLGV